MNQYTRPSECHYTDTEYNHAVSRVTKMSYEQLVARYGKMSIAKKISAFYDALIAYDKAPQLRRMMEREHSYISLAYPTNNHSGDSKAVNMVKETHTLQCIGAPDIYYTFTPSLTKDSVYVENHMGEVAELLYAEARKLWNDLVKGDTPINEYLESKYNVSMSSRSFEPVPS